MVELSESLNPKEMRKSILSLAWPAVLRMLLQSIVGIVDVIMVGNLGAAALAAVDVSNKLVFVVVGSLSALGIGSTALVARYTGAKDHKRANRVIWQSLLSGLVLSILVAIIGIFFSKDLLRLMMILMENADQFILEEGSSYLQIVFIFMIFGLPMIIINAVLQGIGDMKTPLYIMAITNVINTVVNYLLIFGIAFFPKLGVTGAAIGTGLGRTVGAIIGIIVLLKGKTDIRLRVEDISLKFDWGIIKNIFTIGIPAAIEQLVRQSSQIVYTVLVAGLGTLTIAANAVAMNVNMLPIMIGFGFAMAATTLVGQSLGAGRDDLAKEYGKQTTYITMVLMTLVSIPMFIWSEPLINLYTNNAEVISITKPVLKIVIIIQPIFAVLMVLSGALRGAGDTKWTMYITAIGNWGVRLILSTFFGYYLGYGLIGFWFGMGMDVLVRTGLIIWRYRSDKWQNVYERNQMEEKIAA
jgi:putative MATE family efflux protein